MLIHYKYISLGSGSHQVGMQSEQQEQQGGDDYRLPRNSAYFTIIASANNPYSTTATNAAVIFINGGPNGGMFGR